MYGCIRLRRHRRWRRLLPCTSLSGLILKVGCISWICWRKQTASDQWIEAFCDLVTAWKPMGWAEEKGQISAGVGPALERPAARTPSLLAIEEQFPTRGDKAIRAQSIRGRMALEGLYVPQPRAGIRRSAQSSSAFRLASMTTRSMRSDSSDSCSTKWCQVKDRRCLRSENPTAVIVR